MLIGIRPGKRVFLNGKIEFAPIDVFVKLKVLHSRLNSYVIEDIREEELSLLTLTPKIRYNLIFLQK